MNKIAESLYCWNKKAKRLRNRIEYLKDVLFDHGDYEIDTNSLKSTPSDWINSDLWSALEDLREEIKEIKSVDYTPDYNNITDPEEREKARKEKWVYSFYFEEFMPESELDDELGKVSKDIETLESIVSSLHDELHNLSSEKERIYDIKDKLVKKYGTYKETHTVGTDDRQFDLYRFGGFEFHLVREDDDLENVKNILRISAEKTKDALCWYSLEELEEMI